VERGTVESKIVSFIVKMWIDDGEAGEVTWHALVTQVPTGEQCYVKSLSELMMVFAAQLDDAHAPLDPPRRVRLHRRRRPQEPGGN
jgi:hypothetical protein